nr:MAG TPA: hypothetical protein [Caudoviricetes sp.]
MLVTQPRNRKEMVDDLSQCCEICALLTKI